MVVNVLVVQLKADTQDGIANIIIPLANVKEGLAEVPAQVKVCPDIKALGAVVLAVVEPFAELPTALPGLLVGVWSAGAVEYPDAVDGAQTGKGVAERPAFLQSCPKSLDLNIVIHAAWCTVFFLFALVFTIAFSALGDHYAGYISLRAHTEWCVCVRGLTFKAACAAGP